MNTKIEGTPENWDDRSLGAEEEYVAVADHIDEQSINDQLELHQISIRLQRSLIEDFKQVAKLHGLGYQPLMRQALTRFIESEKKRLLNARVNEGAHDDEGNQDEAPEDDRLAN